MLSVASGNTIETLSELFPADTSITGPAFTFQLVLLVGPQRKHGRERSAGIGAVSRLIAAG